MKILVFTDTHGVRQFFDLLLKKAKNADLLVCAGDISDWGQDIEKDVKLFGKTGKPLLIIHGNHEGENVMRNICKKYDFCYYIHKAGYELGNYIFIGYGDGGFSERDSDFENLAARFKKDIKKDKKIILVTHGPAYGNALDIIPGLGHRGCRSIRKFILDIKPMLHICGHFHDNNGRTDKIGKTPTVNPGPEGIIIEI